MNSAKLKAEIRGGRYCFPGGYERVAIMDDGEMLCFPCLLKNFKQILGSTKGHYRDGWDVAGFYILTPDDMTCRCANCNEWFFGEEGEEEFNRQNDVLVFDNSYEEKVDNDELDDTETNEETDKKDPNETLWNWFLKESKKGKWNNPGFGKSKYKD